MNATTSCVWFTLPQPVKTRKEPRRPVVDDGKMPLRLFSTSLLLAFSLPNLAAKEPGFPGAAGFGAFAKSGKGGAVLEVTLLDGDLENPPPGSFRCAVMQKGLRIVKFLTVGTMELKDAVEIRERCFQPVLKSQAEVGGWPELQ
jgi:hypothetical protein